MPFVTRPEPRRRAPAIARVARRWTRVGTVLVVLGAAALTPAPAARAQGTTQVATAVATASPTVGVRRRMPFAPGEEMRYEAHFGKLKVGRGSMRLGGVELVRGVPTWHLTFKLRGGTPFFRVDDVFQSWVDTTSLSSLRFEKRQKEGRRTRHAQFEIFPGGGVYVEAGKGASPTVAAPLDDASFLYFVRTVPLEVGQAYSFDRYFKPDRNPVAVRVVRRERVRVPAGTFDAIVVRPQINTTGLLGKSRRTELWLSDDDRRVVLRVESHLPFGTLSLALTSYRPGAASEDEPAPRQRPLPVIAQAER